MGFAQDGEGTTGKGFLVVGNLTDLGGTETHGWQWIIVMTPVPSYRNSCTVVQELSVHLVEDQEVMHMGNVVSLSQKRKRLGREQADVLRQMVFNFDLDEMVQAEIDNAIYKITEEPGERWPFVRISPEQFRYVVKAIRDCRNVATTLSVWNAAITYIRWDTGEILTTRKQLAEDANTNSDEVSRAMTALTKIGAIVKTRRGQRVVYSINPNVGWNGGEGARQVAAKEAPLLRLVSNREERQP